MLNFKYEKIKSEFDQLNLDVMIIEPDHPKGIIQFSHGMAEHKQRYMDVMQFCAENDFIGVIHDHRGHGDSVRCKDDLGYFYDESSEAIVEDVAMITRVMKKRYPALPLILFGHSMGSLIVRNYMKKYDDLVDGLIVCGSPSKNAAAGFAVGLVNLLKSFKGDHNRCALIDKIAFGSFNKGIQSTYEHAWICSDESVVKAYEEDEKCGYLFTLNGYLNLFKLMKNTYSNGWQVKNPDVPVLFIAGSDDPCIISEEKFNQAVQFMQKCGYSNVKSKLYEKMRHEILNETDKNIVYNDMIHFVNQCLVK